MGITAQDVLDRIKWNIGADVRDWSRDTFLNGKPDTEVTGILTTYAPNIEILRKGVNSGKNLFIVREAPYWARPPGQGGAAPTQAQLEANGTYRVKRDYIEANNLVVLRLHENWQARTPDGQLIGLAKALRWDKLYKPATGLRPWARDNGFFQLSPATLKETAQSIKRTMRLKSIRVGGNPDQPVTKAALWPGLGSIADVQRMFAEPGVDLIVMGEPIWEHYIGSYAFDLAAAGMNKGMIFLGNQASEEPGSAEVANWLRSFVTEVPIEWVTIGEPTWMLT